ncbi:MAG: dihydropteroate synthase [Sediminispirochaetaceae bacterium]
MKIGTAYYDRGLRTYVMGILNVTPDSFSDGGSYADLDSAVQRGLEMEAQGADIIDIGGESTRPGHKPVGVREELSRVIPVIRRLAAELRVPISIDTSKAEVACAGVEAGACLINDVWGFTADPDMVKVAVETGAACCLMHNQEGTAYKDLMEDILHELSLRASRALEGGVDESKIILDPGIGFGKTVEQNIEVMQSLGRLNELKYPWLLGTSRKSMIGRTLDLPVDRRLAGSIATNVLGIRAGADFIRVHDVRPHVQAARMTDRIVRTGPYRLPGREWSHIACISLGSNLGERAEYLNQALQRMDACGVITVLRVSGVYETSPVGKTDQPAFLNAAAVIGTDLGREDLLQQLLAIEKELMRTREERWGPRTIDLDILFYDQQQYESDEIRIPHPRLHERLFVLAPLSEIAPLHLHPGMNMRVFELMKSGDFTGQKVQRLQ